MVHIKRNSSKTFCGYSWVKPLQPKTQPVVVLETTTYKKATCRRCKEIFEKLAVHLVEDGLWKDLSDLVKSRPTDPSGLAAEVGKQIQRLEKIANRLEEGEVPLAMLEDAYSSMQALGRAAGVHTI